MEFNMSFEALILNLISLVILGLFQTSTNHTDDEISTVLPTYSTNNSKSRDVGPSVFKTNT